MKIPLFIFICLILLALVQTVYFYPLLPEVVASHFNGAGNADGWSSRNGFFAIHLGITALLFVLFGAINLMFGKLPDSWWNLPHKQYWLAPERRETTIRRMRSQMLWFGIISMLLELGVIQLAIQANLDQTGRLADGILWAIGAYVLLSTIWAVALIRSFSLPKRSL